MPKVVKVLAHKVIKAGQAAVSPQENIGGEGTLLISDVQDAGGVPTLTNEKTSVPSKLPQDATSVPRPDASNSILLASEHILSSSLPCSMVDQLHFVLRKVRNIPGIQRPHKPIFLGMTPDAINLERSHLVKAMLRKLKDRAVQRDSVTDSKEKTLKVVKVSLPCLSSLKAHIGLKKKHKHRTHTADRVAGVVAAFGGLNSGKAIWQSSGQVTTMISRMDAILESCKWLSKRWLAYVLRCYFAAWVQFCKEEDLERKMILEIMDKIEKAKANLPKSSSFGGSIDQNTIAKVLQRQIQGTTDSLGSSNRNKNTVSRLVNNLEAPARFHDFCLAVTKGTLPDLDIIQNDKGKEQGLDSPRQPVTKTEEEQHETCLELAELLDTAQKLNFEHIDPKVSRPGSIDNKPSGDSQDVRKPPAHDEAAGCPSLSSALPRPLYRNAESSMDGVNVPAVTYSSSEYSEYSELVSIRDLHSISNSALQSPPPPDYPSPKSIVRSIPNSRMRQSTPQPPSPVPFLGAKCHATHFCDRTPPFTRQPSLTTPVVSVSAIEKSEQKSMDDRQKATLLLSAAVEKVNELQREIADQQEYISHLEIQSREDLQARREVECAIEALKVQHGKSHAPNLPKSEFETEGHTLSLDTTLTPHGSSLDSGTPAPVHAPQAETKWLSASPEANRLQQSEAGTGESIECEIVMDQFFSEIFGQEEMFKAELVGDLQRASEGAQHAISVTALHAGSIVADIVIEGVSLDGRAPRDTALHMQSQMHDPESLLKKGKHTCKAVSFRIKGTSTEYEGAHTDEFRTLSSNLGLTFHEDNTLGYPRTFITNMAPGSSSAKSGRIKKGDMLAVVNDEDVYGKSLDYIAALFSQLQGPAVRLGVISPESGSCCLLSLERQALPIAESILCDEKIYRRSLSPLLCEPVAYSSQQFIQEQSPTNLSENAAPMTSSDQISYGSFATDKSGILQSPPSPMPCPLLNLLPSPPGSMPTSGANLKTEPGIVGDATAGLCSYCGGAPGSLKKSGQLRRFRRCARCKNADYCSDKCQKKHYSAHRFHCKQVMATLSASISPPQSSDTIIAQPSLKPSPASLEQGQHDASTGVPAELSPCSGLRPEPCFFCGAVVGSIDKIGNLRLFRRCLRCKNADYCSEKCQRKHWDQKHKLECSRPESQTLASHRHQESLNSPGETTSPPVSSSRAAIVDRQDLALGARDARFAMAKLEHKRADVQQWGESAPYVNPFAPLRSVAPAGMLQNPRMSPPPFQPMHQTAATSATISQPYGLVGPHQASLSPRSPRTFANSERSLEICPQGFLQGVQLQTSQDLNLFRQFPTAAHDHHVPMPVKNHWRSSVRTL